MLTLIGAALNVLALFPTYHEIGDSLIESGALAFNVVQIVGFIAGGALLCMSRGRSVGAGVVIGLFFSVVRFALNEIVYSIGGHWGTGAILNAAQYVLLVFAVVLAVLVLVRDALPRWEARLPNVIIALLGVGLGLLWSIGSLISEFDVIDTFPSGGVSVLPASRSLDEIDASVLELLSFLVFIALPAVAGFLNPSRVGGGLLGGMVVGLSSELYSDFETLALKPFEVVEQGISRMRSFDAGPGFLLHLISLALLFVFSAMLLALSKTLEKPIVDVINVRAESR